MDFSEPHRTGPPPRWSPNGRYVAAAVENRLAVRDAENLAVVVHLFSCLDAVEALEWSPDSVHLMAIMHKRAMLQIWSLHDPAWTCKVDEGPAGAQGRSVPQLPRACVA